MAKQNMLCNYISTFSAFLAYFKCLNEVLRNNINYYLHYDSITWNPSFWFVCLYKQSVTDTSYFTSSCPQNTREQHSQKINGIS